MELLSNISNPDSPSRTPISTARQTMRASSRGERYNRTVRHEWLDQYIIESIEPYGDCSQSPAGLWEAQDHATQWLWTYNNDRPNMGIGGITPAMKLKMAA